MSDAMPDGYDFMETLTADPVFRVTRAAATEEMGRLYVLRLLYPSAPRTSRKAMRAFVALFSGFESPLLNTPTAVLEAADGSLAMRYTHRPAREGIAPLPPLDITNLPHAIRLCRDLASALAALHGQGACHGCLTPASVWLSSDSVMMDVPGYAALLDAGDMTARAALTEHLAPEVREGAQVTPATDLYGFAAVVVSWLPEVRDTPWHRQATDPNPIRRFGSVPEALPGLVRLLETCATEPPTVERVVRTVPVPKVPMETVPRPLSFARLDPGPIPVTAESTPSPLQPGPAEMAGGLASASERPGLPDLRDDAAPRWLLGLLLGITLTLVVLALSLAPVVTRLLGP